MSNRNGAVPRDEGNRQVHFPPSGRSLVQDLYARTRLLYSAV